MSSIFDYATPEPVLRDVFTGWMTGSALFDLFDNPPWSGTSATLLNLQYFGNHSGGKFCSPLVKSMLDDDETLTLQQRTTLAQIIMAKYRNNWQRLWDVTNAEYNPIHNYDVEETITREVSNTGSETVDGDTTKLTDGTKTLNLTDQTTYNTQDQETLNLSDAETRNLVDQTAHGKTTSDIDYRFGLNSTPESRNPTDLREIEEGGNTTENHTGTDTTLHTGTDTSAKTGTETKTNTGTEGDVISETGTQDVTTTKESTEEESVTTNRSGNIGVTTTQKMIAEERELWLWNYFNSVFKDIDSVLALAFYDPCRV